MIIEDIIIIESGLIVVDWIGDSIDENKLLITVGSHFGEDASYELVDFTVNEEGNGGKAYVKQLRGDDMMSQDMKELENAQAELVNGKVPTNEVLPPVARVQATDEQVDELVAEAEAELDVTTTTVPVTKLVKTAKAPTVKVKKAKVAVEKKKKKIDIARSIFSTNLKQERKTVIKKIMEKTGLSKVAAATYYQICKRES